MQFTGNLPTYEIDCNGGLTHRFKNLSDLLNYENAPGKEIATIDFYATSDSNQKTVSIKLFPSTHYSIRIRIEGPEKSVIDFKSKLEDRLAGMRPWYARIAKIHWGYRYLSAWAFVCSVISIIGFQIFSIGIFRVFLKSEIFRSYGALIALTPLMISASLILLFDSYLAKLHSKYFPISVLAIGQGLERHRHADKIRYTVIIGFLVSVVSGMLPLFIAALIR